MWSWVSRAVWREVLSQALLANVSMGISFTPDWRRSPAPPHSPFFQGFSVDDGTTDRQISRQDESCSGDRAALGFPISLGRRLMRELNFLAKRCSVGKTIMNGFPLRRCSWVFDPIIPGILGRR